MPRVRVPNASLIAGADFPILPFLAPRVFAESSIPGRTRPNGGSDGIQKEKEKTVTWMKSSRGAQEEGAKHDTCQNRGAVSGQQKGFTAGFLRMSSKWRESTHLNPVNRLYADISTFARKHARSYATASTDRDTPNSTSSLLRRVRRMPSGRVARASVKVSERDKALALERDRLSNYISRLPPDLARKERIRHGQYRSLFRRVSNLKSWNATRLDLSKTGSTKNRHRLNLAFAALDRSLYPSLEKHTRNIVIKHHPQCPQLSGKLFIPDTDIDINELWTRWIGFDIKTRKAYAYRLLIYLLDRKPDRALRFVQVVANDPLLHGHRTEAIADALGHLSKVHATGLYGVKGKWGADPASHRRLFAPAFVYVFEKALAEQSNVCSQDLLYNLVQLAETEDLKKVFDCLVKHRTYMGFDTLLHYASAFGKAGHVEYALKCLDELKVRHHKAWDSVVERTRLLWTCATILRKSMAQSQDFHSTPVVVAAIVRLGIKMNVLLYNIVMHNAMEAGDYATAFKVYNALDSNGLKTNKHTFSILLHGCTLQNNPAMFQSFAQYCAEVAKETKNAWLATDYLYYLYIRHHADTDPEHASAILWQAYTSFFPVAPLAPVIDIGPPQFTNAELLPPRPVALYIMLQSEIRSASTISNQRVLNLYQRFLALASSNTAHRSFTALTKNPTIWNAFLLSFCHAQQFSSAADLIRDMTSSPAFPDPNIYTWNIFMQAFFKTGQVAAAERVFGIMRQRGVEPDQYSWGVLIRGYAKAQMVKRVGEVMEKVTAEEEVDPDLLRVLGGVVDRQGLMRTLEEGRLRKEERAQGRVGRKAEEARRLWAPPAFERKDVEKARGQDGEAHAPVPPEETHGMEAPFPSFQPDTSPLQPSKPLQRPSTPSQPQPRIRTLPPNDPEVQYRLLQEKLGIVAPSSPPPSPEPAAAGLGFKSVLSEKTLPSIEDRKGKEKEKDVEMKGPRERRRRIRIRRTKGVRIRLLVGSKKLVAAEEDSTQ